MVEHSPPISENAPEPDVVKPTEMADENSDFAHWPECEGFGDFSTLAQVQEVGGNILT